MTKFQAEAPGKLYIAGEYAVVDGRAAIVAAVNRYVKVTVDAAGACDFSEDADCGRNFYSRNFYGKIACEDKNFEPLYWKFGGARFGNNKEFILDKNDGCGCGDRAAACDLPAEESPATNDLLEQTNVEKIKKYYAYVISAMNVVDEYAREVGALGSAEALGNTREYNVHIESDLDDKKTGKKYGLGSSAAVTVAAVRALCEWYGLALATSELCKLAIIASSLVKKSGSGGDVAASAYGGWVLYRAYNREWLKAEVEMIESGDSSLHELLQKKWPRFVVKRLKVGAGFRLLVGWTGSPASSAELVGSVKAGVKSGVKSEASGTLSVNNIDKTYAKTYAKAYEDFCVQSEKCVQKIANALENGDFNALLSGFAQNRALLKDLGEITGTLIETQKLTQLIEVANSAGLPSKTSGAGGGDCGIAIARAQDFDAVANRIKDEWQKSGIEALNLKVAEFDENRDSSLIEQRKDDHIKLACEQYKSHAESGFEQVRFIPNALPQLALSDVDTSVSVFCVAEKWDVPLYINAMTGGSKNGENINALLARVAAKTGVAMACGSLSAALKNPHLAETFSVIRRFNPRGFVMANVSAGASVEQAIKAVEILQANALQIHLNAAQELVMSEGDRDFSAWLSNIEAVVRALDAMKVPVVVKETGCGMSAKDVLRLQNVGVRAVDVGGRGGTNFVAIENARRGGVRDYEFLDSWGLTTVESLLDIAQCDEILRDSCDCAAACDSAQMQVFASGGVRTPLDVVRALKLGASAVGVAGEFLHTLTCCGQDALVDQIEYWKAQIRVIMALLGCKNVADLRQNSRILIDGKPFSL
ncbi:type 2 isopentenyl-diphosphate Delta-isomerase [Gardnerella vaginalis]|uniref:Isopentenyl-diphosphate delta-isomerase n=1 Tax=Gardnerella piotii TaxID=2792977 RepID=A0ABU5MPW3_9BIFI|nr:type 2 isopentenyl-diphosphate Delta-isomerase [Gardnerella piotii]MDZ7544454.1 type 2 isopentenyl-diphosphate Delta-isomerase [Gardnerella piotii]MDZ7552180.1 type 2 isopentenyl-diphosphate Delta-isomerase [Gardnerella piotii]RFT25777.1 type 2 isopentenyl-diphosphate Delta-isomerase [Gardnerella vaginalis]